MKQITWSYSNKILYLRHTHIFEKNIVDTYIHIEFRWGTIPFILWSFQQKHRHPLQHHRLHIVYPNRNKWTINKSPEIDEILLLCSKDSAIEIFKQYNYSPSLPMSPTHMPTLDLQLQICHMRCTLVTILPLCPTWHATSLCQRVDGMWKDHTTLSFLMLFLQPPVRRRFHFVATERVGQPDELYPWEPTSGDGQTRRALPWSVERKWGGGEKDVESLCDNTTEIIPYYRLNHSSWSFSDNKESSCWVLPG
jgi:hypothetical protein